MAIEPTIKEIGDHVFVLWENGTNGSLPTTLDFSRIVEHRDTLSAEVSIVHPVHGAVHWARVNLASTQGRSSLVRALEESAPEGQWRGLVDHSCRLVAQHVRRTEPAEPMVPKAATSECWLVPRWIPSKETTVLFGDGGSTKSLFVLALSVAGVLGYSLGGPWAVGPIRRTLYLDWESERRDHEERLYGLTRQEALPEGAILHRRMHRPLTEEMATIKADVDRHGVDLIICDSLGLAGGPEPEGADAAVRTLMALRGFGRSTRLVVAHMSKASADSRQGRAFGSVYVENIARSVIEVRPEQDRAQEGELTVTLYHKKCNQGPRQAPSALTWRFSEDGVQIRRGDPDLSRAGLTSQILDALKSGSKTVSQLSEEVEASPQAIKKALDRLSNRDKVVRLVSSVGGKNKETLWGQAATNRDTVPF